MAIQQSELAQAAGVPVRITLTCGWCASHLDGLPGVMETATGRMKVLPTSADLRLQSGRPVCPRCSGPLFVDDWKVLRPHVEFQHADDADADDGDEEKRGLVAA